MTEYELSQDLQAIDQVTITEKYTGNTTTLPKGTKFFMIIPRHPGKELPDNEYCLILSKGKMYLPVANQLQGKYKPSK